jgi:hypothetical protein
VSRCFPKTFFLDSLLEVLEQADGRLTGALDAANLEGFVLADREQLRAARVEQEDDFLLRPAHVERQRPPHVRLVPRVGRLVD